MQTRLVGVLWACAVLAGGCLDSDSGGGDSGDTQTAGSSGGASVTTMGGNASSGQGGSNMMGTGSGSGTETGSGTGTDSGGGSEGTGSGGDKDCPTECLRAYTCAPTCDDEPVNNGCCPCPEGTIDTISCGESETGCGEASGCGQEGGACCVPTLCDIANYCQGSLLCCGDSCETSCESDETGYCGVLCSGVQPDPSVQEACAAISDPDECSAFTSNDFPFRCNWTTSSTVCLAP